MITNGLTTKKKNAINQENLDWLETTILQGKRERSLARTNNGAFRVNHPSNRSDEKSEMSLLLKCYESKFKQLEKENIKLNKHIEECHKYMDNQNHTILTLKSQINKYRGKEISKNADSPVKGNSSFFLQTLIIIGLMVYAIYLINGLL